MERNNEYDNYVTPHWLSSLEERLQKIKEVRLLQHEVGMGALCLKCNDCVGLDPHYWRKICKNCRCSTTEHDTTNDNLKFEVLTYNPQVRGNPEGAETPVMKQDHISKIVHIIDPLGNNARKLVKFDWVPPNLTNSMVIEFMNEFDQKSIPISGSQGAIRRCTQLKIQIPLDDYDLSVRNELTSGNLKEFDEHISTSRAAYGQGKVFRYCLGKYLLDGKETEKSETVEEDPRDTAVLQNVPQIGKHCSDEESKKTSTNDEVFDILQTKEEGQKLKESVLEMDSAKGPEPEEPLKDNSVAVYQEFLERIADINICEIPAEENLSDIPCDTISALLPESTATFNKVKVCNGCKCVIKHNSLIVSTQRKHAGLKLLYHPRCFTCHVCMVPLADLHYFFDDDKVFCGRHFTSRKSHYQRCEGCDKLIFDQSYTLAEGKIYHKIHFCCFSCDMVLANKDYLMEGDDPYCVECHGLNFGKRCQKCKTPIKADQVGIHIDRLGDEGHWHATDACFRCGFCQVSLVDRRFRLHAGAPFCSNDCANRFIEAGEQPNN